MPIRTFGFTGGRQTFTVPPSVTSVTIRAAGAVGGAAAARAGGRGAYIQGDFPVTPGEELTILVGGAGTNAAAASRGGGGGGGTFVWRTTGPVTTDTLMIAAGGGGGAAALTDGMDAQESSTNGTGGEGQGGTGGTAGSGGGGGVGTGGGGGGAGIIGNGGDGEAGGFGGTVIDVDGSGGAAGGPSGGGTGGFGGGGGGSVAGGGGGGFSGGGGGQGDPGLVDGRGGGGGGSFNGGINQNNQSGVGTDNGLVAIIFSASTFGFTGSLQTFTVPPCVSSLTILAVGARGGASGATGNFGKGALVQGDFAVTPGEKLTILVGGAGGDSPLTGAGGGGGTFVWRTTAAVTAANLMVAAGGGGGGTAANSGADATATSPNGVAGGGFAGGAGGVAGLGGGAGGGSGGGGGAGIIGSGGSSITGAGGGTAIDMGGAGGPGSPIGESGGFGGGGGSSVGGGGGGGFSGGGGGSGTVSGNLGGGGGGGGSFNGGSNPINMSGVGSGEGQVIISFATETPQIICPVNITATADPGASSALVAYTVTAASPACGIVAISCAPSGETHVFPALPVAIANETGTFPVGTTIVTCTATNAAGNTASCSFAVTVINALTPTAAPLIPNNLQEECIRVQKVYDWVVTANRDRNKVPIPDECRPLVDAAIRAGENITIQCVEPTVPPTFPLIPKPQQTQSLDFSCNVNGIRRQDIIVDGNVVRVGIVRFLFGATLLIRVFANGTLLCEFPATIQFDDEIVLCLPEPLDETNILCRITAIQCNPIGTVLLGGMVELEVTICKEIQAEVEVKLEVLAKFCQPRPIIPVPTPTSSFICPPIAIPPQCTAIFPLPIRNNRNK